MMFWLALACVAALVGYQEWRLARLARELRRLRDDETRRAEPRSRPTKDDIIAAVDDAQRRGRLAKS